MVNPWNALWHEMTPAFYLGFLLAGCALVFAIATFTHSSPIVPVNLP